MRRNKGFTLIVVLIIVASICLVGYVSIKKFTKSGSDAISVDTDKGLLTSSPASETLTEENGQSFPKVSIVAEGLDTPWAIAFLPDGGLFVTERKGTVRFVDKTGKLSSTPIADISSVKELSEGGLHGIALHPNFNSNKFVYLYYTYSGSGNDSLNRVVRMTYESGKLVKETTIIDAIPGASNHDGGRLKFGPDGFLYVTTGDAQEPSLAQDKNSLAGKILRVDERGNPAPGNPFGNRVYSLGHRNPQGITWDKNGQLWSTEHGPSGFETGNDEVNKIEIGKNYGWPDIRGMQTKDGMLTPVTESGRGNAWAPAAIAFVNDRFFFTGLRGAALYELDANGKNLKTHLKGEYGRLREVIVGPDGMLYVSTSNYDGRGTPRQGDDKILRISPSLL